MLVLLFDSWNGEIGKHALLCDTTEVPLELDIERKLSGRYDRKQRQRRRKQMEIHIDPQVEYLSGKEDRITNLYHGPFHLIFNSGRCSIPRLCFISV
jgi:hypothetical protein